MTLPMVEPVHDYPSLGLDVTIEGVISTQYLHNGERMIVQWTTFWESMADYGYVVPVRVEDNPDADRLFPNLSQVMDLIRGNAVTAPGEKILGVTASGSQIVVRVGTEEPFARNFAVTVPAWEDLGTAVTDAQQSAQEAGVDAQRAETAANNVQADVDAAALAAANQVLADLNQQLLDAQAAAGSASTDAGRAEDAADRAEGAADVADVQPASATQTGIVRLKGDLSGTATAPTVPKLLDKYEKPAGGIPEADLDSDVGTALDSARSALQSVPSQYVTTSGQTAALEPYAKTDTVNGQIGGVQNQVDRAVMQVPGQTPLKSWTGTEAQYNAITTKDPNTMYYRTA